MKVLKLALIGLAAAAMAAPVQTVQAQTAYPPLSGDDMKALDSCLALSESAMREDSTCTSLMTRANISDGDLKTILSCRRMARADALNDNGCRMEAQMHPGAIAAARQ